MSNCNHINRDILRLAAPNIVSNVTVPLMGIVSTAIAGHWGDSAQTIGALAIGVSIFNFIYWNCSFLRMGTSGLTAQAFGAGDNAECSRMLYRALAVSAVLGIAVLLLQRPIGELSVKMMNGDAMSREYFFARIWAVPAGIMLFGFNGWFTGMQNAVIPMATSVVVNVLHIIFSLWFALGMDMGIVGIAYASVVAQYAGLLLAAVLLRVRYGSVLTRVTRRELFALEPMKRFFGINRDIILRTFCIVAVYTFFTAASARMDNPAMLAVNTLLMQLFTMFSYMNDGFAYAAEALTGRFIGSRRVPALRECIRKCFVWSVAVAVVFAAAYALWWDGIFGLFLDSGKAGNADVFALAYKYIGWVIAVAIVSSVPFLLDGIMVGATMTRHMRNSMLLSTVVYFAVFYMLSPVIGNNALWLAFMLFMLTRGVALYVMSGRLEQVYRRAE